MQVSVPDSEDWVNHVDRRVADAKQIGLLDPQVVSEKDACLFVPDHVVLGRVTVSRPEWSLRTLLDQTPQPGAGWVRRDDLFDEAAEWLVRLCRNSPSAWLVCEAGFARLGDPGLAGEPWVAHRGSPFYAVEIARIATGALAVQMRKARSRRFLGVVPAAWTEPLLPADQGLFLCDAFDIDSLMSIRVRKAPRAAAKASAS